MIQKDWLGNDCHLSNSVLLAYKSFDTVDKKKNVFDFILTTFWCYGVKDKKGEFNFSDISERKVM